MGMTTRILHLVTYLAVGVLISGTLRVEGLKLAIISSGRHSNLLQISSIVEVAHQRNHSTTVFVDTLELSGCKSVLGDSVCSSFACSPDRCHRRTGDPSTALRIALEKHKGSPDIVLASAFFVEADQACRQLGVPLLILLDNAADVLSIRKTSFSSLPFDLGKRYPFVDTVASAIQSLSISFWDLVSFGRAHNPQMTRHIVTQGILGFDIISPICPNVHPIGFLRADGEINAKRSIPKIDSFIESCGGRFLYASVPPKGSVHGQQFHSVLRAVADETNACVLWHMPLTDNPVKLRRLPESPRVKVTGDSHAAPAHLLHRYKPLLVISNNVSEVLYDSVLAESPIVYVGSNHFSCSQLSSTGIVACPSTLLPDDVLSAVRSLHNVPSVRERVRAARRMGFLMGGAHKTVEVAELVAVIGSENMDFVCDRNIFISPFGYDAVIALLMTFVVGSMFSLSLRCCQIFQKRFSVRLES